MTLAGVYARVKLASLKDKTPLHQCSVWHKGDMLIWKSISLPAPHTHTIQAPQRQPWALMEEQGPNLLSMGRLEGPDSGSFSLLSF